MLDYINGLQVDQVNKVWPDYSCHARNMYSEAKKCQNETVLHTGREFHWHSVCVDLKITKKEVYKAKINSLFT